MPTPDLQSLTVRIEKLERQNRLLKHGGLVLLLASMALIVMGQVGPPRTLDAQSFVLRDSAGIKRAELAVANASPSLRFFDAHGKTHIALEESSNSSAFGPRIELSGEEDKVRLSLGLIREEPHIIVNDAQGFSAQLGSTPDLSLMCFEKILPNTGDYDIARAASPPSFSPTPEILRLLSADLLDYLPEMNERGLVLPKIHL
jgi:hypothetical protein